MNLSDLENQNLLVEANTVSDTEKLLNQGDSDDMPWIAKLLLGAGGWLAAIFLVGFTMLIFGTGANEMAAIVMGCLYLTASIFLSRKTDHPFVSQLTVAVGIAGLVLVNIGVWDMGSNNGLFALIATFVICIVVNFFSKNGVQKFSSVFSVYLIWWIYRLIERSGLGSSIPLIIAVITACIFLSGLIKTKAWRPAMLGTVFGLLFLLYLPLFPDRYINNWTSIDPLLLSVVIALGFGMVIWKLTGPEGSRAMIYLAAFIVLLYFISWLGNAGIAACLGIIVAAHARNDLSLKWFGILGLAVFVVAFYYFLGTPLINKSYLLLGTGAVLLIASAVIKKVTVPT